MTIDDALQLVVNEIKRGQKLWPGWPTDPVHAAGVVCEESGELMQAAMDCTYGDQTTQAMYDEAAHTAATAIRFLMGHGQYQGRPSPRPR